MGGEPFVLKASVKAHTQLPRPIQRPCPAMKLKSSLPKETARQPCSINAPKRGCGQCVELDRGATSPGTASQPTQWSDTQFVNKARLFTGTAKIWRLTVQ
eukprot:1155954-Pelagomonas_calceolata.AAC.1